MDYDLIGHKDHSTFLRQLSSNSAVVFWPRLPETCGRIAVEAKKEADRALAEEYKALGISSLSYNRGFFL